jgi:hypothetical protein
MVSGAGSGDGKLFVRKEFVRQQAERVINESTFGKYRFQYIY